MGILRIYGTLTGIFYPFSTMDSSENSAID